MLIGRWKSKDKSSSKSSSGSGGAGKKKRKFGREGKNRRSRRSLAPNARRPVTAAILILVTDSLANLEFLSSGKYAWILTERI